MGDFDLGVLGTFIWMIILLKIQFATKNTFAKFNDIGGALAHPGTPQKSSLFHSVLKKDKKVH